MTEQLATRKQGINSIEVGLKVLRGLVAMGKPSALRDIADAADMHPAKAHRYLVSFIRGGLVEQSVENNLYDLGPYALEFSLACLSRLDAMNVGASVLEALAAETNESVLVATWGPSGPTIVDWRQSRQAIAASTRTGSVFSVLGSATGRVFAAYLPQASTAALIAKELRANRLADRTGAPRTQEEVRRILSEIRTRGMCRGLGVRMPGLSAFASPIFNRRRELAFVLTVFGHQETFDPNWDGRVAVALRSTADSQSRLLGYPGRGKAGVVCEYKDEELTR